MSDSDDDALDLPGQGTLRFRLGGLRRPRRRHDDETPGSVEPEHLKTQKLLPMRYSVKEDESGRFLTCSEAPNIAIRMQRGLSISASAARKYPEHTIFLDGVAQGEPFMDSQRKVYNLDHHEGCVRAFTLSACEQALVLILKGLDLASANWSVWANEPDLDTIVAIWLLLNHQRVGGGDAEIRRAIAPVVRLQGVIDAHGFELQELSAFPEDLQRSVLATIASLREEELRLKNEGSWGSADPLAYTVGVMHSIDQLVYVPRHFEGLADVEEMARISVAQDRIALICRSSLGIYEVERYLRKTHGDRIGLIILEKEPGVFTLRQVDPFLPCSLRALYERLNLLDPAVRGLERWGGSGDIGGSPRNGRSALDPQEIAHICRWVFERRQPGEQLAAVGIAALMGVGAVALGVVITWRGVPPVIGAGLLVVGGIDRAITFGVAFAAVAIALLAIVARSRRAQHGVRWPEGKLWLAPLPLVVVLAGCGGAWAPLGLGGPQTTGWWFAGTLVLCVTGAELSFRGVVHGLLVPHFSVQLPAGRWFISTPNAIAAICSGCVALLLFSAPPWLSVIGDRGSEIAIWAAACVAMGLVCGVARERSGSLIAPVVLHAQGAVIAWLASGLLP